IARVTTAGLLTEYQVPTPLSGPFGITAGPDKALWFTEYVGNKIGRIATYTTPQEKIASLESAITQLISSGVLNQGQGNELIASLNAALRFINYPPPGDFLGSNSPV